MHREQSMTVVWVKWSCFCTSDQSSFPVLNAGLQTRCSLLLSGMKLPCQLTNNLTWKQKKITVTLVHFWHFPGSQTVPGNWGHCRSQSQRENKTSLCCGLFIKCALCICSLGENKYVCKAPPLFTWPESRNRLYDRGTKCQRTPASVGGDGPQSSAAAG